MPRKQRIDLAGYHHVINRGVTHSKVFMEEDDYETLSPYFKPRATSHELHLHQSNLC